MRRLNPLILIAIAIFSTMACTFSSKLPTPVAPTEAPAPEATRPQTTFIDARTVVDSSPADAESVAVADAQTVADAGDGSGAGGEAYASGGYGGGSYGGGGYGGGSYGGWSGYHYGWGCTPRYDWAYSYVVHYGDTLNNIAWRAGTTWQALAQGNCIANPNYIYAGQYLRLPSSVSYYPPYPPHPYPPYPPYPYPYPTPVPTGIPPTYVPPPVVVGSALTFAPYDEINNNTVILPPDTMIAMSWAGTFPTATDRVTFELIPPGGSTGTPIGIDTNLGDGATISWFASAYTQGTVRAYATFTGGFPAQYSDSYYIIAGFPP